MCIFPFLDLPVEVAERILLSADVPTVLQAMQTSHIVHALVCGSKEIRYKIRLYYHGYLDAPRTATSSYANRRTQLKDFRRQWVTTEPTQNERLYLSSTSYLLEGGVFAMFFHSSNRFFFTRSQGPSRGIRPLSWMTPSLDFKVLTFGMDPTLNLLAVFGMIEIDKTCFAQIRLLTLTDCTPSSLAALPVLSYPGFPDSRYIQESRSKLSISGSWLGFTWREVLDGNWERLLIWNWKLGNICLYLERVLAFSIISDKYLLTAHQKHLSVYDLSKEYPQFSRLDPSTEPVPVYQLALPGIYHAAGLHRSGSLNHVSGSLFVPPPPDAVISLPVQNPTFDEDTSSDSDDEGTVWESEEVPFYEDPSRNVLAVNLIHYVGHWPRFSGTTGTTIIIPLQCLVDFVEETITNSAADTTKRVDVQAEAQVKAEAQMQSELGGVRPLGISHHHSNFEFAELERQRRIELTTPGLSVTATGVHDPTRMPHKPRHFRPSQWLKHALVFNQETQNRAYDYRRSIVSGSRFVSNIEVKEGERLFQLIEFNPTWVKALEQRLGRPARDIGVHYQAVRHGHPVIYLARQNWDTEGLIVPVTFGEHMAVKDAPGDSDGVSAGGFLDAHLGSDGEEYTSPPPPSPATPTPTPTLTPSSAESEIDLRLPGVDSPGPSWYGWRVARCGEVKYAWKLIQVSEDTIALDVSIQEDSLIYTAAEDDSPGARVYFAIGSF